MIPPCDVVDAVPFVYETYCDEISKKNETLSRVGVKKLEPLVNISTKMYNRGPIMSNEERLHIRDWANELMGKNKMKKIENGRLDCIICDNNPDIIPIVHEIRHRIEIKEDLCSYERETEVNDFVAFIPTGGFIHKHCDPNSWERGLFHVRFNVFITLPLMGGTTYYDGHEIDSVEGSYVLCRSGIDKHWSERNEDTVPRISLSFGYLLPPEKVDELCKDSTIGIYTQYYPLTLNMPTKPVVDTIEIVERGETGSNIFTVSYVFTNAQCDEIVDYIKKKSALWQKNELGYTSNVECNFLPLKTFVASDAVAKYIDDLIYRRLNAVLNAFRSIRPDFKGSQDTGYTLRHIYGGTREHSDGIHSKTAGFTKYVRCLSCIAILNDDYDGGIFNFTAQNLKFKVKKGEVVMFPPYWTHPHSVTSVGEGQARYAINTWILENFID